MTKTQGKGCETPSLLSDGHGKINDTSIKRNKQCQGSDREPDSDDCNDPLVMNNSFSDGPSSSEELSSPRKSEKLTLQCRWEGCHKVFHKRRHLEDHIRSHTGERPFVCEYQGCYKSYTKKEHLRRHEISHNGKSPRFSCDYCNQTYSLKANLTRHVNRTHDEARFQCTIDGCEKSFRKNFQLKGHLSKVHSVKPYVCAIENCKREFSQKSHLNQHLKSHKGYDCKVEGCAEHCETWSQMRKHVAACHTQESTCHMCGKSFPSAQYKAHVKQHKKQRESFVCTYPNCHRAYFDQRNLNTHVKVFHEQARFACTHEGCDMKLVSKQKLSEHMKKIHDPDYVHKQKVRSKKKRKQRMERNRKHKVVNEVMNLLLNDTEVKLCATSRREFEGREVGAPDKEVSLRVVNDPGRLDLRNLVSADGDPVGKTGHEATQPAETSASSGIDESGDSDFSDEFSDETSDSYDSST